MVQPVQKTALHQNPGRRQRHQSFLPGGQFDPTQEQHVALIIDHFRREGGAKGLFTDVHFDGVVIQISVNEAA